MSCGEVEDALLGEVDVGGERRGPERVDDDLAGVEEAHPGQRGEHRDDRDQGGRRQDPAGAAGPERPDRDLPGEQHLAIEQPGDQVAGDDEEDVDADEAAGQERHARVGSDDQQDRDGAQPLDVPAKLFGHRPVAHVPYPLKVSTAVPREVTAGRRAIIPT